MVITTIDKSCSVRNHGHLAHLKVSKKLAQYVLYIKARQVRKTSRESVMEDAKINREERSTWMKLTIRKISEKKNLIAIAVFFISLSNQNLATSLDSSSECAVHFKGTVQTVVDSGAPFSINYQKEKVTFHVDEDFSTQDEVEESYSLEIIKGGPHKFKEGQQYEVFADRGYLCNVKSSS